MLSNRMTILNNLIEYDLQIDLQKFIFELTILFIQGHVMIIETTFIS